MKYFLHTDTRIRIVHDALEFECTPERFQQLEPTYPGKGAATVRYWTPGRAYLEGIAEYDGHDCSGYCDNIPSYTECPVIMVNVSLSKTALELNAAGDSITFTVSLEDEQGNILPIDHTWFIRLTHESQGDVDRLKLDFVQGQCSSLYRYYDNLPLGTWLIDESKFDTFEQGGITYQFKLVTPVSFVVYR
jgi:hypothetical protein